METEPTNTFYKVEGDAPVEVCENASIQTDKLRNWLLTGAEVNVEIARLQLGIGSTALPRRILDCKEYLGMIIKAKWVPYITKERKKTKLRMYYMEKEDIQQYIAAGGRKKQVIYPKRNSKITCNLPEQTERPGHFSSAGISACSNI